MAPVNSGVSTIVGWFNYFNFKPVTLVTWWIRTRTKINDDNKNILLRKTVKKYVKDMLTEDNNGESQTSYTFVKQFQTRSQTVMIISITCGTNETFNGYGWNTKYTVSVMVKGTSSGVDFGRCTWCWRLRWCIIWW